MTRLARRFVDGLAAAHKQAHPDPDPDHPAPTPEEIERSALAALRRRLYGWDPKPPKEGIPA